MASQNLEITNFSFLLSPFPVQLRAHHLISTRDVFNSSREEHVANLLRNGYVGSVNDPFVSMTYEGLIYLFNQPRQKCVLIENSPDIICRLCGSKDCPPKNETRDALSFCLDRSTDRAVAEHYDLKLGESYTIQHIREKVGF